MLEVVVDRDCGGCHSYCPCRTMPGAVDTMFSPVPTLSSPIVRKGCSPRLPRDPRSDAPAFFVAAVPKI